MPWSLTLYSRLICPANAAVEITSPLGGGGVAFFRLHDHFFDGAQRLPQHLDDALIRTLLHAVEIEVDAPLLVDADFEFFRNGHQHFSRGGRKVL